MFNPENLSGRVIFVMLNVMSLTIAVVIGLIARLLNKEPKSTYTNKPSLNEALSAEYNSVLHRRKSW